MAATASSSSPLRDAGLPGVVTFRLKSGATVSIDGNKMRQDLRHANNVARTMPMDGYVLPALGSAVRLAVFALALAGDALFLALIEVALAILELIFVVACFARRRWLIAAFSFELISVVAEVVVYLVWWLHYGGTSSRGIFWSITALLATRQAVSVLIMFACISVHGAIMTRDLCYTMFDLLAESRRLQRGRGGGGGGGEKRGGGDTAGPPLSPPPPPTQAQATPNPPAPASAHVLAAVPSPQVQGYAYPDGGANMIMSPLAMSAAPIQPPAPQITTSGAAPGGPPPPATPLISASIPDAAALVVARITGAAASGNTGLKLE